MRTRDNVSCACVYSSSLVNTVIICQILPVSCLYLTPVSVCSMSDQTRGMPLLLTVAAVICVAMALATFKMELAERLRGVATMPPTPPPSPPPPPPSIEARPCEPDTERVSPMAKCFPKVKYEKPPDELVYSVDIVDWECIIVNAGTAENPIYRCREMHVDYTNHTIVRTSYGADWVYNPYPIHRFVCGRALVFSQGERLASWHCEHMHDWQRVAIFKDVPCEEAFEKIRETTCLEYYRATR